MWEGQTRLHLPFLPEDKRVQESRSHLHIETDSLGSYAVLTYDWEYEGARQEGAMLLAGNEELDTATCGWCDSWHQSDSVMSLTGTGCKGGTLVVKGSYKVPDGPDWGWRIELERKDEALLLRMFNVTPEGEEVWAVEGNYSRA